MGMYMEKAQDQVIDWLLNGEVGASSRCMAFYLAFGKLGDKNHPLDPADFDRCLQMLKKAPSLRERIHEMSAVSSEWEKLAYRWEEIESCHLDEVGLGWTKARCAPKTYALMKEVLG